MTLSRAVAQGNATAILSHKEGAVIALAEKQGHEQPRIRQPSSGRNKSLSFDGVTDGGTQHSPVTGTCPDDHWHL